MLNRNLHKRFSALTAAAIMILFCSVVSAFAQAAIKTDKGYLFVYNDKSKSFTLDIVGKEIKTLESSQPMFAIDGRVLQILIVPVANFAEGKTLGEAELLETHRIWETDYLGQEMYKKKLTVESQSLNLGERKSLFWGFTRPSMNQEFDRDYFLTMIVGDYLLALGSPLTPKDSKTDAQKFLSDVAKTIKLSDKPYDIEKLAAEIRNATGKD
jgi:hypothetical protein